MKSKEDRQITIKVKNTSVAETYRKSNSKHLQNYIETRLRAYSTLKSSEVEAVTQLKSGDIRLLMKTRGAAKTLKNAKEAKD